MRWITNTDRRIADKTISELSIHKPDRNLTIGEPQQAKTPNASLKRMGMVGIYDCSDT